MKYKFLFLLLFVTISYGQKKYVFDYLLEYEYQTTETAKVETRYIVTNSKDNNYDAVLVDYLRFYCRLFLSDDLTGITASTSIPNENIANVGTINLNCNDLGKNGVRSRYNTKRLAFTNLKDTVFEGLSRKHYQLDAIKRKDKESHQYGVAHYIVENDTEFHLPLLILSSQFDERITSDNIPNGIAREMYSINSYRNQKEFIYKLISYTAISMQIVIPANCEILIDTK